MNEYGKFSQLRPAQAASDASDTVISKAGFQIQDGEPMPLESLPDRVHDGAVAVIRARLAGYDAARAYAKLSDEDLSRRDIPRWTRDRGQLPRVDVLPLADGFSGATPYEICERYAVGEIDRDRLIDELTRFPYVPGGTTDGYDSLIVDPPGTWSEVSDAECGGLIDEQVYEEVFTARHG